jgi:hypothetical protein
MPTNIPIGQFARPRLTRGWHAVINSGSLIFLIQDSKCDNTESPP